MGTFTENYIVRGNLIISSENATTVFSTGFDVSDADSIIGVLTLSSAVGLSSAAAATTAMSMHAAGSATQSTSVSDAYVDLYGTSVVVTTASDYQLVCEVTNPQQKYVRFEIVGTTAIYSNLMVIVGKSQSAPVTALDNVITEQHVSPTTGTA